MLRYYMSKTNINDKYERKRGKSMAIVRVRECVRTEYDIFTSVCKY